jgi:3-oxoacyl-[acyl-carrier-protein] synthase II
MIEPSGEEAARALEAAILDARAAKEDVDYVNLHGTSTQLNDLVETRAVKRVFGAGTRIAASATKSMIGHPQGACGAAGVAAALFAMTRGEIPPTVNYENPDPECDLDYTPNRPAARPVRHALCNTLAFGSKNSSLLVGRGDAGLA